MPINALTAGVAALAINSTAFTIEIFRGGFAAVPVAQHDAARALGLRPALIMALVVVPQVFRIVLPPLGNQIVSVVLGSAQASIIGVAELTYQTQSIGSSTFRYFELFTIAALFYIACAQLISLVWREHRRDKGPRKALVDVTPILSHALLRAAFWRPSPTYSRHWAWADLMRRAFDIDVLACPRCGGRLRLIATVEDPEAISVILAAASREEAGRAPPSAAAQTPKRAAARGT
jgi:hypothetical protein